MSSKQLSTKESSTDGNVISIIDDHNSQLIVDLINSSLQKSYLDSSYGGSFWKIQEIFVITNEKLEANYRNKSEELKAAHANLYPSTLFTCYRTDNCLNDIALQGLRTKATGFNILGDNSKGVTLCQHADIQLKAAEVKPTRCYLFLFACMSSCIARVDCCEQGKNNRCPVSDYDCHISSIRPSLKDSLLVQAVRAQIYFYDVNERGAYSTHPRQCLPLACVVYTRSEPSDKAGSVRMKHIEVGQQPMPAEAVIDLTGADESVPLLDEAKGASVYNRLRRHFRKATSAEEIYSLSNYFPKPVDGKNLPVAGSSFSEQGASWHRVAQSSLQSTMADTACSLAVTTSDTGQERAKLITCQENSVREKMSQFCVNKNQKNPSSVASVTVPNVPRAVGIRIGAVELPSTGGTTFLPNTVSFWSRGPTTAANTVSWATFAPNAQVTTVTANAMPRALSNTVGASIIPRTMLPRGVGSAASASSQVRRASFTSTTAYGTTVGQASLQQCPRLVRYVPRILRPPIGVGGIRLLSNSNAATVAVSSHATSSRPVSGAVPTLHASNIVPLVTRPHSMAMVASMPSLNGSLSNIRLNALLSSNTVPLATRPKSVTIMASMPSSFSGGSNIRPSTTSGGIAKTMQLIPQWQAMLPQPPLPTGQIIPLYADRSQANLLASPSNHGPQAQLTSPVASQPVASQPVSLAGTPISPAGMVSLVSQPPVTIQVPSNLAQFTVTRSADQQRESLSAAASEQNLFFGGSEVEDITIEDEGLVISGVRPIVIMPDGTCDEDEEQNCSLADGVQTNAETKAIDCKDGDFDVGILKMEENSSSRVKNRKSHTIILDADEGELNNEVMTELAVHRLVDQEMDEDGDLLDRQLRISDVVSLQTDSDLNDSSVVHRRLLGELWMENADQLDNVTPVENSLSVSNCKIISLASAAVKNAPQVSASLSLEGSEIVRVGSNTGISTSASNEPVQSSVENCLVHPTASVARMTSSAQMQDDAQASENKVGEKTAEKERVTSADGSMIKRGSQKQRKTLFETVFLESTPKKQKPLLCDLNKPPVSGMQKHDQPSTGVCVSASEESTRATKDANAKQRQAIPVFTVCADGSVAIRLDTETEANEDMQDARHCGVRIELLKDVQQKDTLMKALAKVLGNIHVTDLRNSSDEIVYRNQNENTEKIAASSSNLQRNNLAKVNGVEQRTGLKKDSFVSHNLATPDSDNIASDTNILIESVHSMGLDKFDEISKLSGNVGDFDPLPSKMVTSENDEERVERLDDTMIHRSRRNSVGSMDTSDFEENDVEDDEPFQNHEDETEKFSNTALQTSQGFRQQFKVSDVTCSTETSNARLNDLVSGIENVTQLATKNHSKSYAANAELPIGSENKSEISKLNKRQPLDSAGESETSGIINKEVLFECENSGLNEELSSKESHSVRVCEEEHSIVCKELPLDSGSESEISRLQTKTPLNSVNMSKPSKVVEQLLLDSALETCRMNEHVIDVVNAAETCNMNKKQPVGLETESETCGINQGLPLDSGNEHDSFGTCKELHLHVAHEHNVGLAKESQTFRMHEEQQLDLTSAAKSCRAHEQQHSDLASASESCRACEEQHLDLANAPESIRTHEEQHLDVANAPKSSRTHKEQHLNLANESDTCRMHEEQHLDFTNEKDTCRIHEERQLDLTMESELCRTRKEQHLDLANESDTCRMHEEQQSESGRIPEEQHLDLAESESCRTHEEQHLDLENESDTCRMHEEQQSESGRIHEEQHLGLASELESCRTHEGQHLDLASASQTSRSHEEQHLDLASASESCRTHEEQHLDLASASQTSRSHEEQHLDLASASESCRTHEEQHLDLTNETETCRIHEERQFDLAGESESCRTCEEQHLHLASTSESSGTREEQHLDVESASKSSRTHEEQHLVLTNESDTCRMHEEQQSESGRMHEEQHLGLASESESCRTHEGQHLDLASESESSRTRGEQHIDLTNESDTCRKHEKQQSESCTMHEEHDLDLARKSESCRTREEQYIDLTNESDTCRKMHEEQQSESRTKDEEHDLELAHRTHEEQYIDLTDESDTYRMHEEHDLDLVSKSESCRTREEQYIDLTNESDTCRLHEEQHLDMPNESETLGINKQLPLEIVNEMYRLCEEQLLKLADELPMTRTLEESPLNLAVELGESGVNENVQLAKAANSVNSNFKDSETLLLGCLNSVTSGYATEAISPISPACSTEEILPISPACATEAISPISPACSTEEISPISPACATEAISPACSTEEISPISPACSTEEILPISPACATEAISPISPACSTEEISFVCVTEATSSACVTKAFSPACVTETISPAFVTEAISPAYVTEAISPAYITEPISPAYVTEPISPAACSDESVSPTDTYRPVTENVSPPCHPEDAPVAHAVTSVHESDSVIASDGLLYPSAFQQSGSEINLNFHYTSKSDSSTSNTGIAGADDSSAVQDVFPSENKYLLESVKKSVESDSETSLQMSRASEREAATRKKKVLSLEEYRQNKLKRSIGEVENTSHLRALETRVQNMNLDPSSHHFDKHQLDQEKGLGAEGSCLSQFDTFSSEERPNDQLKIMNSVVNLDLKISKKVMEKTNSAVIESTRPRDPRLQGRGCAFKNAEATWNSAPSEMEKEKELDEARVHMIAQEQCVDLDEEIMNSVVNLDLKLPKKVMENTNSAVIESARPNDPRLQGRSCAFKNAKATWNSAPSELEKEKELDEARVHMLAQEQWVDLDEEIINSVVNLDLKMPKKVTEKNNSAVIESARPNDPRLQGRSCAFKNAEATWNSAPSEMEKDKELPVVEARVHMMAQELCVDLDEDVVGVDTQQQLANHLEIEEDESSSQNMEKLLNYTAMEDTNGMAREQKDELEIELIEGDKEQENGVNWGCKVIDEVNKDEEIQESESDGKEPGKIEDEICISEAEASGDQVVNEQVVEVLDDWDEYGDFVIMGSGLDDLSDDDKESGEVTSDSSDEFGGLVVNDEDEYDCNLQLRKSIEGETEQEDVWHLLDDALTVVGNCESEDNAQTTSKQQLKCSNRKVQKKRPIIIKLKTETAKRLAQDDRARGKDDAQENAGTVLKENSEGTEVTESCLSHHRHYRKHKSHSKTGCKSRRTRRNNPAGSREFSSAEHLKISDEMHDYDQPSKDQSPLYRCDIYQGAVRKLSSGEKGCVPIDIEIIKVLRNVDDVSAERSVFGGADSFVTLLMKEFHHLPEDSQRYYSECIRQTLQVDREFVTGEHIYGSMAELLTEDQRQHIQHTNISPVVARELHVEDILKKVKLELGAIKPESGCDLSHHNLLILTKEMLYDQMNELKCYQKSRSVFVLPDEFRLPRESGKYISVDGSLLFLSKHTLSVNNCNKLYCYRTEIEEMEDELNESLGDAGGLTEEICRKLSVLYLRRRRCLQDIGCSADQLHTLKKKFSKNLSWFRRMRDVVKSRDCSKDGQEMALINCLNQRIEKLKEYIKVIASLKNVSGIWYPDNSDRKQL